MAAPEKHALLSPSSAKRWLNCPRSVRLSEHLPDTTSGDAEKGRLAHAIAELKARKKFTEPMSARKFNGRMKKLKEDPQYEEEMQENTDIYIDVLTEHAMSFEIAPCTVLECAVPIGAITGEKDATGTADCIQIGADVLWVTDYKNGKGVPVSAEENPQMMLYALGALTMFAPFYGNTIQTIKMTIVQPRLNSVTSWEISRRDLEAWGAETVKPRAAEALAGEGEQRAGGWCRFCKVKPTCRIRANNSLALEEFKRSLPPTLTDEEVSDALKRGSFLVGWYNDLKEYAQKAILDGKEILGFKVVEGRGSRQWSDQDEAFDAITAAGVDSTLLWERRPLTPPALEKALGKKTFNKVADDYVIKQPGKPALVPWEDNRPSYNAAAIAFRTPSNN